MEGALPLGGAASRARSVARAPWLPPARMGRPRRHAPRAHPRARRAARACHENCMISEPMTLATDYLLAAVTAAAGVLTLTATRGQASRRAWGAAFIALALGAALGGTHHGFRLEPLWLPTVMVIGVASAAMLTGSAFATTRGALRRFLVALALVKLALFWAWVWRDDRFVWVVADTGVAFVL